jgi:hypothetical protein
MRAAQNKQLACDPNDSIGFSARLVLGARYWFFHSIVNSWTTPKLTRNELGCETASINVYRPQAATFIESWHQMGWNFEHDYWWEKATNRMDNPLYTSYYILSSMYFQEDSGLLVYIEQTITKSSLFG